MRSFLGVLVSAGHYGGRSGRREFWAFTLACAFVTGCLAGAAWVLGRRGGGAAAW